MIRNVKGTIKRILKRLPVAFSKNHRYDIQTRKIVTRVCEEDSNCVDVGAHEGEILDLFLARSPGGTHFAFEPIPQLCRMLERRYRHSKNVRIFELALSKSEGSSTFNHVISNPAYSGLKKRKYDRKNERDEIITVRTQLLDNVLPKDLPIAVIKIDVEGGEMDVLEGATSTLTKYKPALFFEFGIGGSDIYGTTPVKLYNFLGQFGYRVFLLDAFLKDQEPLTFADFEKQFEKKINYFFFAF